MILAKDKKLNYQISQIVKNFQYRRKIESVEFICVHMKNEKKIHMRMRTYITRKGI